MLLSPPFAFYDVLPAREDTLAEVMRGLRQPQKEIQAKYFYDARGCELFEAICKLPEYYPTRTELAIMRAHAPDIAAAIGKASAIVEIGCGNSAKSLALLGAVHPAAFVAVDIATEQLETSCGALSQSFPDMTVVALRADFTQRIALPEDDLAHAQRRVLYMPGSTIGNFTPAEALEFLTRWRELLGPAGGALIGVDLKKNPDRLNAAYNDARGVTAAFNLNVLTRLNRELGANFDVDTFRHRAFYNATQGRIEMHLVATLAHTFTIADEKVDFRSGETIHTENSYKYSVAEFESLGRSAGYLPAGLWIDNDQLFAVHYFTLPV